MSLVPDDRQLRLAPYFDPAAEATGFDPASTYVEHCWLPLLGPTSTWLYRRLFEELLDHGPVAQIDATDLARDLGLGSGMRRLGQGLLRLQSFGFLAAEAPYLLLQQRARPLSGPALARLTGAARRWHDALTPEARPV